MAGLPQVQDSQKGPYFYQYILFEFSSVKKYLIWAVLTFHVMLIKHEVSKFEIADASNFLDGCITV